MCGTASGWSKMAFVCVVLGMALHIAGWASNNWMTYETTGGVQQIDVGLWKLETCTNGNCEQSSDLSRYETDEFNAVRALETITFCGVVFIAVLLGIYVFAVNLRRQSVAIVIMVLCFLVGTVSMTGMILWLVFLPDPYIVSFSMGLTVLAFILVYIAGTLLIPDVFEPHDSYLNPPSRSVTPYTPTPPYSGRRWDMVTPYQKGGNYGTKF